MSAVRSLQSTGPRSENSDEVERVALQIGLQNLKKRKHFDWKTKKHTQLSCPAENTGYFIKCC